MSIYRSNHAQPGTDATERGHRRPGPADECAANEPCCGRAGATHWTYNAEGGRITDLTKYISSYALIGHTSASPYAPNARWSSKFPSVARAAS